MTTTLNTSCSENTMVLSATRGVSACMYFLVVEVMGTNFWRTLPIWCTTCMGEVPSLEKLVRYSTPSLWGGWTGHDMGHVFVNDGLADLSDDE